MRMVWFRKPRVTPARAARQLREHALAALRESGATGEANVAVAGAVMELGFPEGTATLVCLADGSTSLYLSSGGGVIGAGEHTPVRRAAAAFLATAAGLQTHLAAASETPRPASGEVRFCLAGENGFTTAVVPEAALVAGSHALTPLFAAGQAVITEIRDSTPQ